MKDLKVTKSQGNRMGMGQINRPRAIVVDDDATDRSFASETLSDCGFAVEAFEDAQSFLAAAGAIEVGCVVLDLRLPDLDGIEVLRRLLKLRPDLPVIMASGRGDIASAVSALKLGAHDFFEKPVSKGALVDAVTAALKSRSDKLGYQHSDKPPVDVQTLITRRELEVLKHLLDGKLNKKIAFELDISERTVEAHRARMMRRVGARSFAELIKMAVESGVAPHV